MKPLIPLMGVDNASTHAALRGAWLASYTSTATQTAYRADVRHYLTYLDHTGLDLLGVSRKHIDLYARTRQPFDAPATLARRLACISALYRYAQAEELIPTNPATLVRRPVVVKDPLHHRNHRQHRSKPVPRCRTHPRLRPGPAAEHRSPYLRNTRGHAS